MPRGCARPASGPAKRGLFFQGLHGEGVAEGEVGVVGVGADVGAAFPASGAGLVFVAAVDDFDFDGGELWGLRRAGARG